ncbi:MAG: hypothetical protein H0T41_11180, partial [Rhodobacteraceae bacterium]|nr:hypothetical protein [Paracoccaceae bacterium]
MALTPRIEIRQNASLVMTPQLQQAIKLLAMNNLTLAEFVALEVEKNPLLELAPPPPAAPVAARVAGAAGDFDDAFASIAAKVGLAEHLHVQIATAGAAAATVEAAHLLVEE